MAPSTRRRPSCLVIGAAKAGTTSLFNVLASHPQVAASLVKETRFFSDDDRFQKGLDWYRREYFGRAPEGAVRMEASPAYLTWSDKVAPRIRRSEAEHPVVLVAILRDPTRRAYSHYCHRVRLGHEALSFADALAQEDDRLRAHWDELSRTGNGRYGYARASCYATRLQPFLAHFDRSQFFFLLQEDLQAEHFTDAMKRLLRFLQIDEAVPLQPARLNVPTRGRHRALTKPYWRLKNTFAGRLYTSLVPPSVRRRILPALFPASANPAIDPDIEHRLRIRFAPEVRQCEDLIQRDLSHWLPA